jgi:hypothetical protein
MSDMAMLRQQSDSLCVEDTESSANPVESKITVPIRNKNKIENG